MSTLAEVKSWMQFYGWRDGGGPGSVKLAYGGSVVAKHGDAQWVKDVEEACAAIEREAARREIERREREGAQRGG